MERREFWEWIGGVGGRRVLVMGVLNVTPDSFSDGGEYPDIGKAVARAEEMVGEGADWIDVGGESTRPGAGGVGREEQLKRVLPVIEGIRGKLRDIVISIDTMEGGVAEEAVKSGADVVNDVSGGMADGKMLGIVGRLGCGVVLMHMQGTPETMQVAPSYRNVVGEVRGFLEERVNAAVREGVEEKRILIDPGIGFGKTVGHNLELLKGIREIVGVGRPVVLGTSRKGFIGKVTGEGAEDRRFGTAGTVAWGVANGVGVVRVHDVKEMVRVVKMMEAIVK